ncbi:MAG: helix-turn-helix transcriptional regulator [Isosphaeraceae bacterium]
MTSETKRLLNADEVAAMLGISERTLWRLLSAAVGWQSSQTRSVWAIHPVASR